MGNLVTVRRRNHWMVKLAHSSTSICVYCGLLEQNDYNAQVMNYVTCPT